MLFTPLVLFIKIKILLGSVCFMSNHSCEADQSSKVACDWFLHWRWDAGGSSRHLWHENCGRPKFLGTLHLLQSTWTVYAVNPFPSVLPSCDHKTTTSGRNSLTKKVTVLSQLWLSPLWNTTYHSLYFKINYLCLSFCSRFQMGNRWWFYIMFSLCFVLANNRLVGTSERTRCCFRESERHAIAVLSDLNNTISNLWSSGKSLLKSKMGSWR